MTNQQAEEIAMTSIEKATEMAFRSASCRVWGGPQGVSSAAILSASDEKVRELPSPVEIRLLRCGNGARGRTIGAASSSSESNGYQRSGILLSRASDRALLLPDEQISWLSIYSPSPLSMSVVVVLELDGGAGQQCYFLGGLTKTSDEDGWGHLYNADTTEELLVEMHSAFPDVPLTPAAREVIAKRQLSEKSTGVKRPRKSLDATSFYGEGASKLTRTVSSDATGWMTFYDKLQFRVSRSLMCQLEGTAPVSASFPRQQEAFEFADQVVTFRRELALRRAKRLSSTNRISIEHPRSFSFESAPEGKRRFLVASLDAFWKSYQATPPNQRHVYEIIREHVPCRLYFDLEFKRALNQEVDGDKLVTLLISLLQLQLYRRFGLCVSNSNVLQLDSSTATKFSRHLIFHFPGGELFADNIHAGAFVREFIADLVDCSTTTGLIDSDTASPFLVRNTDHEGNDQWQLFIDTGVYTRNRMFRILGSSKFRKQSTLQMHPSDSPIEQLDVDAFSSTLVCPYSSLSALESEAPNVRLLRCPNVATPAILRLGRMSMSTSARVSSSRAVECRQSVWPELDAFIRSVATHGGIQGEIRAIQMLFPPAVDGEVRREPRPWMITYHMMRNRWCGNIQRAHRSNNVMFIVDIASRIYYQKCHDPVCQAADFRSPSQPLPAHIQLDQAETPQEPTPR